MNELPAKKSSQTALSQNENGKTVVPALFSSPIRIFLLLPKRPPESDCVSKILELYKKSDPFLCFAVPALSEAGVLKIEDDKEREYYEWVLSL